MAMAACPECGNQISDKASTCPHCGAHVNNYFSLMLDLQATHDMLGQNGDRAVLVINPVKTYYFLNLTNPDLDNEAHVCYRLLHREGKKRVLWKMVDNYVKVPAYGKDGQPIRLVAPAYGKLKCYIPMTEETTVTFQEVAEKTRSWDITLVPGKAYTLIPRPDKLEFKEI